MLLQPAPLPRPDAGRPTPACPPHPLASAARQRASRTCQSAAGRPPATQPLLEEHPEWHSALQQLISGGPVVDDRGKLIGVISEGDCMKEISDSRYFNMPILDKTVGHFMTKEVETLPASMTLFDAASKFHETSRRRFPVLENNNLVGQVSRKDVVIAAINLKSQSWR